MLQKPESFSEQIRKSSARAFSGNSIVTIRLNENAPCGIWRCNVPEESFFIRHSVRVAGSVLTFGVTFRTDRNGPNWESKRFAVVQNGSNQNQGFLLDTFEFSGKRFELRLLDA